MLTPNGGVFGRNPKFNNVTVAGTLTSAGNVTLGTGANLVMASGNGISFAATSDPSIPAVAATGFITRTATNVANNDTVTIGTTVYTFKTTLTPADYEVLIGADAAASLTNLANAINGTGGSPGDYQVPSANASASAGTIVGSVLPLTALTAGTAGNSIALAETSAQLSVSANSLRGGIAAGTVTSELLDDYEVGTWTPGFGFSNNGDLAISWITRLGHYVKIGKTVHAWCRIESAQPGFYHSTATGTAAVTGLPYTASNRQSPVSVAFHNGVLAPAGYSMLGAYVSANSTSIIFALSGTSGVSTPFPTTCGVTHFPSGTFLLMYLCATYQTA